MARTKVEGHCRICGRLDYLTFEHIPPRSAFNDSRVLLSTIDEWMATDRDGRTRGSYQQGGAGGHVLCGRCNNSTGRWYASEYVRWAKSIVPILARLPACERPGLLGISGCYPLRLLKQAVVMFLAASTERFADGHPDLRNFVLDKRSRNLPPRYEFYMTLYRGPMARTVPFSVVVRDGRPQALGEVAFAPFAFMVTFDSPPHRSVGRITHFSSYDYDQPSDLDLPVAIGEGHTPFPEDYRTKAQVERDTRENEQEAAELRRGLG